MTHENGWHAGFAIRGFRVGIILSTFVLGHAAAGAPVVLRFDGTVTSVAGEASADGVTVGIGEPIECFLAFDSDAPDVDADPGIGLFEEPVVEVRVVTPGEHLVIRPDTSTIETGVRATTAALRARAAGRDTNQPVSESAFTIVDAVANADLLEDFLPTGTEDFGSGGLSLAFSSRAGSHAITATLDAVPEPSLALALSAGAGALSRLGRRRIASRALRADGARPRPSGRSRWPPTRLRGNATRRMAL